jgi:hypothetical protein
MKSAGRIFIAVLALPLVAVTFLWLPFGFSLGGVVEEWGFLELFARNGVFYIVDEETLPAQIARPLNVLPQALAYTLDSDTFFYWHIFQAASLTVKGACAAIIGMYLTANRMLAAILGLVTLLYPADTMQLNFRSLSVNWAVALALAGSVLFLLAFRIEGRLLRVGLGAIAFMIFGTGLLMWEGVAGLAVLPFLVMFAREGKKTVAILQARLDLLAIWLCGIAGWFTFFVLALRAGSEYQTALLSGMSFDNLPKLLSAFFSSGFYRVFYECWIEIADIAVRSLSNFIYLICFVIMVSALLYLANERQPARNANARLAARTIVAGLIAFLFGYAPFLASYSHLLITQRTFLATAVGGALVLFGVIVYLNDVIDRRIMAPAAALLIGGCMLVQLYQFDRYNRIYAGIYHPLLSIITPFVWKSVDHPYTVVFSDYGYLSDVWDLGLELKPALAYLLPGIQPKERVFICETHSGRLLPRWHGEPERRYCTRTSDSVLITAEDGTVTELKGAAIARLASNGAVSVEGSETEPTRTALPSRVVHLLSAMRWDPKDSMFRRGDYTDRYECHFEYMWGYAVPCRTFGFFGPQPLRTALGSSYAWIGETNAGLIFDIEPSHARYRLVIEIERSASPSRQVEVNLNGSRLASNWRGPQRIEASFSGNLLTGRNNVLELRTELDQNSGLSIAAKSVLVIPQDLSD